MMRSESWRGRYGAATTFAILTLLVLLTSLAFVYADSYLPAITDWYMEKAVAPGLVPEKLSLRPAGGSQSPALRAWNAEAVS